MVRLPHEGKFVSEVHPTISKMVKLHPPALSREINQLTILASPHRHLPTNMPVCGCDVTESAHMIRKRHQKSKMALEVASWCKKRSYPVSQNGTFAKTRWRQNSTYLENAGEGFFLHSKVCGNSMPNTFAPQNDTFRSAIS